MRSRRVRIAAASALGLALVVAIVLQRATIADAVHEIRTLSGGTILALAALGVVERLVRADLVRVTLPGVSLRRGAVMSEVGGAVNKCLPAGGPVATLLRWRIARDAAVRTPPFLAMLVATGVAAAFVSWAFPLVAMIVDLRERPASLADAAIVAACSAVLIGSAAFWAVVLRSPRAHAWVVLRSRAVCRRIAGARTEITIDDPEATVDEVFGRLRSIASRPGHLLARAAVAHGAGAVILLVALSGVGVGGELGPTEFFRVYFVAHVIGSFAPTPGGVGVVEAGLTGALVAAGVDAGSALAGVLVFRLVTYFVPIVLGTLLYVTWQRRRSTSVETTATPGSDARLAVASSTPT